MSNQITQILQVGAVGSPNLGDGRMLPYLTIDCTANPELEQLIEIHYNIPTGDVVSSWCWRPFTFFRSSVYLRLDFSRPVTATVHLEFPVDKYGYVVDWIMTVKGLYLQSSKYGHVASVGFGKPAVIIEVPSSATFPIWPKLYKRILTKRFKKEGFRGKEIDKAIADYKTLQRQAWFRRKLTPDNI